MYLVRHAVMQGWNVCSYAVDALLELCNKMHCVGVQRRMPPLELHCWQPLTCQRAASRMACSMCLVSNC